MKSLLLFLVALGLVAPSAFSAAGKRAVRKEAKTKPESETVAKAVRVEVGMKDVYQWKTPSTRIRFFVNTGSTDVPIISLGDNSHFPAVVSISARERHVDDMAGVVIDVIFKEAVSLETEQKSALAINLWQPTLTKKEYPIFPSDGKKVMHTSAKKNKEDKDD